MSASQEPSPDQQPPGAPGGSGAGGTGGAVPAPADDDLELVDRDDDRSAIHEPGRLMRIALMLREMQEEVRRAATDEAGRERLRAVHDRAVEQLCEALSADLRDELNVLTLPFDEDTPSESEILIAQAQLIGWLEGLFQGIQAAIVNQQLHARQQLADMRKRGLPPGTTREGQPGEHPPTGQYL